MHNDTCLQHIFFSQIHIHKGTHLMRHKEEGRETASRPKFLSLGVFINVFVVNVMHPTVATEKVEVLQRLPTIA